VRHAIRRGYNDVVRYVWANGLAPTRDCLNVAALHGNLECFACAHEAGVPSDACDWSRVVATHHVVIVCCACARSWVPTQTCAIAAARAGRVEMVECLAKRGVALRVDMIAAAAEPRCFDSVRYLQENGYPWERARVHDSSMFTQRANATLRP
jgi:hypothetical protein